jgi:initiation factor 1A
MYQASIRDKKKHKIFNHQKNDNYELNQEYEEYAYVKKLLGNCRVHLVTASGIEAIGVIRGSLRKFSRRVIIEIGDIVVISKRDYQADKVDIVHKYNLDQVQTLIAEKKLTGTLCSFYSSVAAASTNEVENDDSYINFAAESDNSDESD